MLTLQAGFGSLSYTLNQVQRVGVTPWKTYLSILILQIPNLIRHSSTGFFTHIYPENCEDFLPFSTAFKHQSVTLAHLTLYMSHTIIASQ